MTSSNTLENNLGMTDIKVAEDNEMLLVSWALSDSNNLLQLDADHFVDPGRKEIIKILKRMKTKKLRPGLQTIVSIASDDNIDHLVNYEVLSKIQENFKDFSNIDYHLRKLKDDVIAKRISESFLKIINDTRLKNKLKINSLREEVSKVHSFLNTLGNEDKNQFYDSTLLSDAYLKKIEARMEKDHERSIGCSVADSHLLRPGHMGTMSVLAADSGGLKSLMALYFEENLLSKKICVLKLSPEMDLEINIDRKVSMTEKISMDDIQLKTRDPEMFERLKKIALGLKKQKNYCFSDDSDLTFDKIITYIAKARESFQEKGVLPADGYIYVVLDLFDRISSIGKLLPENIKIALTQLDRIAKSEGVFFLNLVQMNENRFRQDKPPRSPDDIQSKFATLYDLEGSSAYKQICRSVITLNRPLLLKKRYFSERMEEWNLSEDFVIATIAKQNEGGESQIMYTFDVKDGYRIRPLEGQGRWV